MKTYVIKIKGDIAITANNEDEAIQKAEEDLDGWDIELLDVEQMTEDDYDPYE